MAERKCRFCLYWHSRLPSGMEPKDESIGECRVNPPSFTSLPDSRKVSDKRGAWPETYGRDWCGQFTLDRWPQSRGKLSQFPNLN